MNTGTLTAQVQLLLKLLTRGSALFVMCWITLAPNIGYGASLADLLPKIKTSILGVASYQATRSPQTRLLGTGFVIGDGTLVATNAHVVNQDLDSEARERIVVLAGRGPRARLLEVEEVARDAANDLALLRLQEPLPAMTLAESGGVREGEIYAFTGFPIGTVLGLYPVTHRGMIAAITPIAIPAPSSSQLSALKIARLRKPRTVYQLDGTAYPGNSGSPLYDMSSGKVVGIVNRVFVKQSREDVLEKPSGISYAIPVSALHDLLKTVRGH